MKLFCLFCLFCLIACSPKHGYQYKEKWRSHPETEPIGPYHIRDPLTKTTPSYNARKKQPVYARNY